MKHGREVNAERRPKARGRARTAARLSRGDVRRPNPPFLQNHRQAEFANDFANFVARFVLTLWAR